jgi:uncharacterized protein YPO0396
MREQEGQPARVCVVADQKLSIAEHFSAINDISELRKRLKGVTKEVHDSFPPYVSAFLRRFGIQNDQALDLFHQTVSMNSVGNLTDFVRQHMLQPFPVEERIANLVAHVDDLTRAHEAVLSDDSAKFGLDLFQKLNLQLLVVTPLQKIHVIEPYVANVGFVSNLDGQSSKLRNLTITEYREEKARRGA